MTNRSPLSAWETELSTRQIDRGLRLLDELGMAEIYGGGSIPDHGALDAIRRLGAPHTG